MEGETERKELQLTSITFPLSVSLSVSVSGSFSVFVSVLVVFRRGVNAVLSAVSLPLLMFPAEFFTDAAGVGGRFCP